MERAGPSVVPGDPLAGFPHPVRGRRDRRPPRSNLGSRSRHALPNEPRCPVQHPERTGGAAPPGGHDPSSLEHRGCPHPLRTADRRPTGRFRDPPAAYPDAHSLSPDPGHACCRPPDLRPPTNPLTHPYAHTNAWPSSHRHADRHPNRHPHSHRHADPRSNLNLHTYPYANPTSTSPAPFPHSTPDATAIPVGSLPPAQGGGHQ